MIDSLSDILGGTCPRLIHLFIYQRRQATPQQRAALYRQNGIWFDALTTLGELRLTQPQDSGLTTDWNHLLQSVG